MGAAPTRYGASAMPIASEPMPADHAVQVEIEELPLIDQRAMRDWCGDMDRDDVVAVLARVPEEGARCLGELRKAVAAGDLVLAKRSAHRLKGMAANLGAARLARAARGIELSCQSIDDVGARVPALERVLVETLESLSSYR
jgi:hypothetical protein